MPSLDEEFEDLDPSTSSDLDETAAAATPPAADDAASSPATGEDDNELLSVVRDVVGARKSDAASPAEGEEVSGQAPEGGAKKADDENYSDVPFNKHPRFQQLLRKSKAYEQDALRYQNVERFLDDAGLTAEEAHDALQLMGLAKTNPAEAFRQIRPWLEKLVVAAGEVIPEDLRQRVQKGELTEDAALEVSRSRATTASVRAAQSFREQQDQRRQERTAVSDIRNAATSWESDRQLKDPNFATKMPAIMKEVLYLQRTEGTPTDAAGVRAQLDKAYKAVNAALKPAVQQQRPAVRPVTGGQVAGNQRPATGGGNGGKEMSTLDIIRANRRTG